jgi:hypothetical protein
MRTKHSIHKDFYLSIGNLAGRSGLLSCLQIDDGVNSCIVANILDSVDNLSLMMFSDKVDRRTVRDEIHHDVFNPCLLLQLIVDCIDTGSAGHAADCQ